MKRIAGSFVVVACMCFAASFAATHAQSPGRETSRIESGLRLEADPALGPVDSRDERDIAYNPAVGRWASFSGTAKLGYTNGAVLVVRSGAGERRLTQMVVTSRYVERAGDIFDLDMVMIYSKDPSGGPSGLEFLDATWLSYAQDAAGDPCDGYY